MELHWPPKYVLATSVVSIGGLLFGYVPCCEHDRRNIRANTVVLKS